MTTGLGLFISLFIEFFTLPFSINRTQGGIRIKLVGRLVVHWKRSQQSKRSSTPGVVLLFEGAQSALYGKMQQTSVPQEEMVLGEVPQCAWKQHFHAVKRNSDCTHLSFNLVCSGLSFQAPSLPTSVRFFFSTLLLVWVVEKRKWKQIRRKMCIDSCASLLLPITDLGFVCKEAPHAQEENETKQKTSHDASLGGRQRE